MSIIFCLNMSLMFMLKLSLGKPYIPCIEYRALITYMTQSYMGMMTAVCQMLDIHPSPL